MLPGESSCPGGSEYVWQRGIEVILGRVTGGRSLPYTLKMAESALRADSTLSFGLLDVPKGWVTVLGVIPK